MYFWDLTKRTLFEFQTCFTIFWDLGHGGCVVQWFGYPLPTWGAGFVSRQTIPKYVGPYILIPSCVFMLYWKKSKLFCDEISYLITTYGCFLFLEFVAKWKNPLSCSFDRFQSEASLTFSPVSKFRDALAWVWLVFTFPSPSKFVLRFYKLVEITKLSAHENCNVYQRGLFGRFQNSVTFISRSVCGARSGSGTSATAGRTTPITRSTATCGGTTSPSSPSTGDSSFRSSLTSGEKTFG